MEKPSPKNLWAEDLKLIAEIQSTILLVEDQCIAAKIARNILLNLSCQIDVAVDGKTALELIKHRHYDLIFMDIGLPDINGHEVTRRIRANESAKSKPVPIIALTAHGDTENQQLCRDAGINAIITKPLRTSEAIDVLTAFIPHRQWLENRQP